MPAILAEKARITLRDLKLISLHSGSHIDRTNGLCVMEAAAWMAGEPHSDRPQCVCPVIGAFMRSWNDALPSNEDRDRLLKPLAKTILNTNATREIELTRAMLCVNWYIRVWLTEWLALVPALDKRAEAIRKLNPLQTWDDVREVMTALNKAKSDAEAARSAAESALKPSTLLLQDSAVDLVKRMCAVK